MFFQYTSDLHLELYDTLPPFESLLTPCAQYLVLAGDIGHPKQLRALFAWALPKWKRIFYVAGNHEYYGADYAERHAELVALTSTFDTVTFLHAKNPSFACEDCVVIGSTLWTHVPEKSNWTAVRDYRTIRFPGDTRTHLNALHAEERTVLEREITSWKQKGFPICVITHHMPSFDLLHPKFAMSTVNDCFASSCDALVKEVDVWIYGHTHSCSQQRIHGTLCVCNAKGYEEEEVPGWRPDAFLSLSPRTPDPPQEVEEDLTFL